MSKIFNALNQKPGQVPDQVLAAIGDPAMVAAPEERRDTERFKPVPERPAPPSEIAVRSVALSIPINSPLFPFNGEHWSAGEQYRLARTRIVQHPAHPHSIVVSSSSPADGKTLTAINLAAALAIKGETRVLLVDADLRLSAVHNRVGIPVSPGLTELLTGAASPGQAIVRAKQFPDLYILPAGAPPTNPTELLGSSRWRTLCKELSASYDFVIFDSPPIGVVADFDLLQSVCDGVLLVARPDHTPRKSFLKTLEMVPKEKRLGVILNSVQKWFLTPDDQYSGYAGYYSNTKG